MENHLSKIQFFLRKISANCTLNRNTMQKIFFVSIFKRWNCYLSFKATFLLNGKMYQIFHRRRFEEKCFKKHVFQEATLFFQRNCFSAHKFTFFSLQVSVAVTTAELVKCFVLLSMSEAKILIRSGRVRFFSDLQMWIWCEDSLMLRNCSASKQCGSAFGLYKEISADFLIYLKENLTFLLEFFTGSFSIIVLNI